MEPIELSKLYNPDLEPLQDLLAGVRRPGDFFVQGELETPLPRVEVTGVGVLSFPVPAAQVQELIQKSTRAPYGRGEETVLDEAVRKVWQIAADKVTITGKSWDKTFQTILTAVVDGLGCADTTISPELYKLLVYDPGAFFKPHRDTEKTEGMIGTLVVVLPSQHRGGELVIRHGDREVTVDLSTTEVSELRFSAFYADCEHEVRPITEGNRVCLIYNLIQPETTKKKQSTLQAPLYDAEANTAAGRLREAFSEADAPAKLVWLLEHQYSPAGLAFAGLKGSDAALSKVLTRAAQEADCAVHLAIVHIEETGPAELDYDHYYGRRRRWRDYDDDEAEEDAASDSFEVVEVSDASYYVAQWRDEEDQPVDYGKLPLEEREVLPAGVLDDEEPDKQRVMEATGNEGATFERSYHRAALVIWPRHRYAAVLLQSGTGAALPYLEERLNAAGGKSPGTTLDEEVTTIARQIVDTWETSSSYPVYDDVHRAGDRSRMVHLLGRLGDKRLLKKFIGEPVAQQFDGSETEAVASSAELLGPEDYAKLLSTLVQENMLGFPQACVGLLHQSIRNLGAKLNSPWKRALERVAVVMVEALPNLKPKSDVYGGVDWQRTQNTGSASATMVIRLLDSLRSLGIDRVRGEAVQAMIRNISVFAPDTVILPALVKMQASRPAEFPDDNDCVCLWRHTAQFHLDRSETPPEAPTDWKLEAAFSCACEDCAALQKFAQDPASRVARFRIRKDRRQHLHRQIEHHDLDMTHITERKGSPQTLVCTKTRRTYQRQCKQHELDRTSMESLLKMLGGVASETEVAGLVGRLTVAKGREPKVPPRHEGRTPGDDEHTTSLNPT